MSSSSGKQGNKKRLARAKAKPGEDTSGSARGSHANEAKTAPKKSKAQAKAERKKRITGIVIIVFAVIMALSMMLPSCSAIFANNQSRQSQSEEDSSKDASTSSQDASTSANSSSNNNLASIDANYQKTVSALEDKLKDDSDDLATLLNLGNDYMAWGYSASMYATTDAERTHVNEVLQKAMDYYDRYLKLNDSNTVRVNRALCQLYQGDTNGAQSALEDITKNSPDCALAWANLGMVYEYQGNTDSAKSAYKKAQETDPKDEYGAKTFADTRLAAMDKPQSTGTSTSTTTGGSSTGTTSGTGTQGLSDALGGLGL